MKLIVETSPWHIDEKQVEIRTFVTLSPSLTYEIREVLDKDYAKDTNLMKRMIDRMFYEMRTQIDKKLTPKEKR